MNDQADDHDFLGISVGTYRFALLMDWMDHATLDDINLGISWFWMMLLMQRVMNATKLGPPY